MELIHLDPSVRAIASQDDVQRTMHLMKDIFIYHPRAQRVQQFMTFLHRSPERYRPVGLVISGGSGSGKTAQLRAYERANPPTNARDGGRVVPVLYVEMPEEPTPASMYKAILFAAGLPWKLFPPEMSPRDRVIRGLRDLQTRLLLIDEVNNACDAAAQRAMVKCLRMLSNGLRIPVVLAGTEEILKLFSDMSMASRWPFVIELPLWTESDELQLLLNAWQRLLPLRLPSNFNSPQFRKALLEESGGILDLIWKSITYAAIAAIRLRRECVTPDLLAWWRDPPMLPLTDSSVELAQAWLSDQRKDPNPLKVYPLPAMRQVGRMMSVKQNSARIR